MVAMSRKKLTLSVDPEILRSFREQYRGSISAFLDGCMLTYLRIEASRVDNPRKY